MAFRLRVHSFLLAIAVVSFIATGLQSSAQTSASGRKQEVPSLLQREHVASVSFAQITSGKTTLAEAYGEQSPGIATSTTTLYNIASMSKPISAEVLLRLASKGRLLPDEPMYKSSPTKHLS